MSGAIDYEQLAVAISGAVVAALRGSGVVPVSSGAGVEAVVGRGSGVGEDVPSKDPEHRSSGELARGTWAGVCAEQVGPEAFGDPGGVGAERGEESSVPAGGSGGAISDSGGSEVSAGAVPRGPRAVPVGGGGESGVDASTGGFMSTYVRIEPVRELAGLLERACGHKVPKSAMGDLALARYTAATVPAAFLNGRARLKGLAIVGDAALDLALLSLVYRTGGASERMQCAKEGLTDPVLAAAFASSEFAPLMLVGGGVTLAKSKTGATALEALAGVLALHCGYDAVSRFLRKFSLHQFGAGAGISGV